MELRGKRVLITGASRGVGECLARSFTAAGATVALVARTEGPLRALAAGLGGTAYPADLSDPKQVDALIDHVERETGPIDVLVNNAGVGSPAAFTEAPDDDLRRVTEVNYLAAAELCRQAIPRMLQRGGGRIVNISSQVGCGVVPGLVAYCASKAALSHFTAGLRADLRGLPIGITLVELGAVGTDMLARLDDYEPAAKSVERLARTRLMFQLPREKVADEVVEAVQKGRKHVRLPKRTAFAPMMSEAPRRAMELLLTGVPHQVK